MITAVGLVDGEQFVSYDHINRKMIPKTDWLNISDPAYWESEIQHMKDQQDWLQENVLRVMERFSHNKGAATLLQQDLQNLY